MSRPTMNATSKESGISGSVPISARGWVALSAIFVFMVINFADKALLGIAAEPMMKELSLTPSQYGLISSGFFFLFSLSSLVVGFLTTRFSTKPILIVMAIVWTVAQAILISPLAGFWTLLFTRILLGAGEGPAYGVTTHAAMQWFAPSRRGIPAALVGVAVPAGTMLAVPILGQLVTGIGWRESFGVLALASLAWCIVWWIFGKDGPFASVKNARSLAEPAGEAKTAEPADRHVSYGRIFASRTFIGSVIGGVASYWSVVVLVSWVPLYLTEVHGMTPAQLGWVVSLPWAAQIVTNLVLVGWVGTVLVSRGLSSRIAHGVISASGLLLSGLAMLLLGVTDGAAQIVVLVIAFGVGTCVIPASQPMIGALVSVRQRGAVIGAYVAIYSLTGVFAPVVTGSIVEGAPTPEQGYATTFLIAAGLAIAGALAMMLMVSPERDALRFAHETATGGRREAVSAVSQERGDKES
ncbi:MAG: MFS transporter [Pseudoclavibacter sp.]